MIETTDSGLLVARTFASKMKSQKSEGKTPFGSWPAFLGDSWGRTAHGDVSLSSTNWGAAFAYLLTEQVHICVDILVNAIKGMPWKIVQVTPDPNDDNIIISNSNDDLPRHSFHLAMRDFRRQEGQSFLGTLMFDYTLYGEIYIERSGGFFDEIELNWLNPLGMQRNVINGQLIDFRYGWDSQYEEIQPNHVAYYHTRHPFDDFAGYSKVMAVMSKINIARNFDRFLASFFKNNATPHTIFSPEGEIVAPPDQTAKLQSRLRAECQDVDNMHRVIVLPRRYNIQQLALPELEKFNIEGGVSTQIFEGMGVPQAMAGNTSATPYKDGDETTNRFYLDRVFPAAKELQDYINSSIMPFFDRSHRTRFQFDTSFIETITESDQLEASIANSQLHGGYISLGQAAEAQELPSDEWMNTRYMVEGVPMTREQIGELVAAKIRATEAQAMPFGETTPLLDNTIGDDLAEMIEVEEEDTPIEEELEITAAHSYLRLYEGKSLYPDERIMIARIDRELSQWCAFELNQVGKAHVRSFGHYVTPVFIQHAIFDAMPEGANKETIRMAFKSVKSKLRCEGSRLKSISTYRRRLRSIVTQLWRGEIKPLEASNKMDALIEQQLTLAFEQGVKRAGKTMDELSSGDRQKMTTAIDEEKSHVSEVIRAIQKNSNREGGALAPLRARIDLWVSRWSGISDYAFSIAGADKKLKWVYDPRKEHCPDCLRLNGRVYLGSVWALIGIHPKSAKLKCFGGHCGCGFIETDEHLTRGRRPSYKEYHHATD